MDTLILKNQAQFAKHWASVSKVVGSILPWPGICFSLHDVDIHSEYNVVNIINSKMFNAKRHYIYLHIYADLYYVDLENMQNALYIDVVHHHYLLLRQLLHRRCKDQ